MSTKRLRSLIGTVSLLLIFTLTPILFAWVYNEEFGFRRTMLRHFGSPNGLLVPDVNIALNSDEHPILKAAAYRLADMGVQGAAALPVIETYFWNVNLDGDASWLLTFAATKMGSDATELLGLAHVHPTNGGQGLATSFFNRLTSEQQIDVLRGLSAKGQKNGFDERILKAIDARLAELTTEGPGESEAEDRELKSFDPMEVEDAIAVLNDVWKKDASYPRSAQMQQQLERAVAALRAAEGAGAIRVAEWMLRDNTADDFEVSQLFGSFGLHRQSAIPTLIQGIADLSDKRIVMNAIRELENIGPPAQAAVPALLRAMQDRQTAELGYSIPLQAESALKWIDPEAYVASQRSSLDLWVLLSFALAYLASLGWFVLRHYRKRKQPLSARA